MAISAMHGTATGDLLDAIAERLPEFDEYRAVADTSVRGLPLWDGRMLASHRC